MKNILFLCLLSTSLIAFCSDLGRPLTRSQAAQLSQERVDILSQLNEIASLIEENRDCGNCQTKERLVEEQEILLEELERINHRLQFLPN